MSKHTNNLWKNWKIWAGILLIVLIITIVCIFAFRNKMTPEETVSKFMYLIENKEYEKAKKLSSKPLEKLDILSNINPSKLSFDFSNDKKEAISVMSKDEDMAQETKMYINLKNTLLGWKITEYKVVTDFIEQEEIQKRLENGEEVSDGEFLHWGSSEQTNVEDIPIYANNHSVIMVLFAHFMENGEYEKAQKLYEPTQTNMSSLRELTEEEIKEFNWAAYEVENALQGAGTTFTLNDNKQIINVMISGINNKILSIYKFITSY